MENKNDFPRWNRLVNEVLARKERQTEESAKKGADSKENKKAVGKR